MKKIFIAALAVLAFAGCNNGGKENGAEATENSTEAVASSDVAYVNVEYVLAESDIVKSEGTALREKVEKTQQKLANRQRNIENEQRQLEEKYRKGLITTRDAESKMQELQKRANALQNSMQKDIPALQEEEAVFNNRLNDLVMRAVQAINADKKYKMVLQATALLDADPSLDISEAVLAKVNELYKEDKESSK